MAPEAECDSLCEYAKQAVASCSGNNTNSTNGTADDFTLMTKTEDEIKADIQTCVNLTKKKLQAASDAKDKAIENHDKKLGESAVREEVAL